MAALKGLNYTKSTSVGADKVGAGELGGKIKHVYEQYTLPGAILAAADTIDICELPAGAMVIEAVISCASLGTTGIMDLGYTANGADIADPNAFISGSDAGGQAVTTKMTATPNMVGYLKKFTKPTLVQLVATEASTETASVIKVCVQYVVD